MIFERLQRLAERIHDYSWWQIGIEVLLIWIVVFIVFRFIQGTRAAGALKGTLFIIVLATLVVRVLGQQEAFQRIKFLYDTFLTLLAITLIVVFQPELRRGLIRLGETQLLRRTQRGTGEVIDSIVDAATYLSKASFGALIVIEREHKLKSMIEGGTPIAGQVSARLLETIFYPGSALHDLAVIIRGGAVLAAGVQLPLADPEDMPDPSLGSRHRAAVGVTQESDAIVVVVSEETGAISIGENGRLMRGLSPDELREQLWKRLRTAAATDAAAEPAAGEASPDDSVADEMLSQEGAEEEPVGEEAEVPDASDGDRDSRPKRSGSASKPGAAAGKKVAGGKATGRR